MKETTVAVSEAARHFDDLVERASCEGTTLVLVKNGHPVARLVPELRRCTGRELADAVSKTSLLPDEAAAWHDDMRGAREALRPPQDKWR